MLADNEEDAMMAIEDDERAIEKLMRGHPRPCLAARQRRKDEFSSYIAHSYLCDLFRIPHDVRERVTFDVTSRAR